jgi:hypothetical protein
MRILSSCFTDFLYASFKPVALNRMVRHEAEHAFGICRIYLIFGSRARRDAGGSSVLDDGMSM